MKRVATPRPWPVQVQVLVHLICVIHIDLHVLNVLDFFVGGASDVQYAL